MTNGRRTQAGLFVRPFAGPRQTIGSAILAAAFGLATACSSAAPASPSAVIPSVAATASPAGLIPSSIGPALAGEMAQARAYHTATLLPDGRVLVAGGFNGIPNYNPGASAYAFDSAELYDARSRSWTATGGLIDARFGHTATLLPDGTILVAGGYSGNPEVSGLASAELYNPRSGTWAATGSMTTSRGGHTATLLPDGTVLVTGGDRAGPDGSTLLASAELYDPARRTWTATGNMIEGRFGHTATLLPNGNVLVAGGMAFGADNPLLSSAEVYHPSSGSWSATGNLIEAHFGRTAALLPDGRVLVMGMGPAETYDPSSGSWMATGNLIGEPWGHTTTLLLEGKVLVAGGAGGSSLLGSELYNPNTGVWTATGGMVTPRVNHTATLLLDGRVLVAGGIVVRYVTYEPGTGWDSSSIRALASAELYDPDNGTWTSVGK